MKKYFEDIDGVESGRVGRKLDSEPSRPTSEAFAGYKRQLRTGEHLYMLLTGGFFPLMVCVDAQSKYEGFYAEYYSGKHLHYTLYALPAELVAD